MEDEKTPEFSESLNQDIKRAVEELQRMYGKESTLTALARYLEDSNTAMAPTQSDQPENASTPVIQAPQVDTGPETIGVEQDEGNIKELGQIDLPPIANTVEEFEKGLHFLKDSFDARNIGIIDGFLQYSKVLMSDPKKVENDRVIGSLFLGGKLITPRAEENALAAEWINNSYQVIRMQVKRQLETVGYRFLDNRLIGTKFDPNCQVPVKDGLESIILDREKIKNYSDDTIVAIAYDGYWYNKALKSDARVVLKDMWEDANPVDSQ